jgi:cohesin loading factor subunit SCC2
VLSQNTIYRGRTSATVALLERMINPQEDDSVRDLIQETFVMLWFDPHHSSQYHVSDGTMTPRNNSNTASSIACQMVDVMKLSEHSAHIVSLIRELCTCPSPKLLSRKDGKEKYCVRSNEKLLNCDSFQTSSEIEKHITSIASSLVEQLLSFEGVHSTDTNVIGHFDHSSGDELTAIIRTVSIFSESVPCSLVKHIDSLIPFLKADNGIREDHEATVVMHVCKIMSNLVQTINTFELLKFSHKSLIEDLNRIVYRFGSAAMSASIAFMARLSEKYVAAATTENVHEENLFMLASKFYSYLLKTKDAMQFISATSPKVISNLHRSITGLGLICRFNKSLIAEPVSAMNLQIIPASQLTWSNIGASAFAVFEYYCEHGDTNTRCHSLRAITAVCISEPRILLAAEQRGLFARSMYMDCDVDMISTCLGCWEEMLISEELRLENGDAKREMHQRDVSLVEQISGDQDGEASLFGSCCIQHSRVLLEISLHKNAHVRYQSLSLTDVLLRQGLMNPMEVVRFSFTSAYVSIICLMNELICVPLKVPYLFCLQGDVDNKIQQYALKLLLREGDRRPDMLRQRLYGGICGAFHFQRKLEDKPQPTALTDSSVNSCHSQLRHTFSEIFKHFISSSRSQCIKILSSLVESFRHSSHSSPSKSAASAASINANEQKSERILFHRFIAETIVRLFWNIIIELF